MFLRLQPLRFTFAAREAIHFPAGKSANVLRGAFGLLLRRLACRPECSEPATCEIRDQCPYARLFEPTVAPFRDPSPSGFAEQPRPYVFRAIHLDAKTIEPKENFYFDLYLFDTNPANVTYLERTFAQLSQEGIGPGRGKADLLAVTALNEAMQPVPVSAPLVIPLIAGQEASHIKVKFVTPTELKSGNAIAPRPEFVTVASRARDRISMLSQFYGDGPLNIDFRAFTQRAAEVKLTSCRIEWVNVERRSSRTLRVHPIGGFIGEGEYQGDLTEFLPYLQAARWTGIGRQTVWGKGQIELL